MQNSPAVVWLLDCWATGLYLRQELSQWTLSALGGLDGLRAGLRFVWRRDPRDSPNIKTNILIIRYISKNSKNFFIFFRNFFPNQRFAHMRILAQTCANLLFIVLTNNTLRLSIDLTGSP